jgi:hypothetical protein
MLDITMFPNINGNIVFYDKIRNKASRNADYKKNTHTIVYEESLR